MIGQSEMKRGSGLSEWSGRVWRHTGMWLQLTIWTLGNAAVVLGWGSGGTMHLEERCVAKYTDMEACKFGWQSFQLAHPTSPVTTTFLDLPANAWSFIVATTK